MKSLPETELWKKIKTRLGRYEEEPDDQWDSILAGLNNARQPDSIGMAWSFRIMLVLLVAYLLIPNDMSSSWSFKVLTSSLGATSPTHVSESNPTQVNQADIDSLHTEAAKTVESPRKSFVVRDSTGNGSTLASAEMHSSHASAFNRVPRDASPEERMMEENLTQDVASKEVSSNETERDGGDTNQADDGMAVNEEMSAAHQTSVAVLSKDTVRVRMSSPETKKGNRNKKPLQLYVSITPSLSYYKLAPDQHDQITMKEVKPSAIFSTNRIGISLDAGIHRPFTKKLAWFAGVTYYQQQQTIRYTALTDEVGNVTSHNGDYTVAPGTSLRQVRYSMHNAGLSSGLLYTIKASALQHQIGTGLQFQYGLSSNTSESSVRNDSQVYLNYQILYRFSWKVSRAFDFYLQPAYTQGLFEQKVNSQPFSITPSRAGIGFGLIYHVW